MFPRSSESESCQFSIHPNDERESVRLSPIWRKRIIGEPAVVSERLLNEVREIVDVELVQVGENGLLLLDRGRDFDLRRQFVPLEMRLLTTS